MTDPIKPAAAAPEPITPQTQTPPEPPVQPTEPKEEQPEQPKVVTVEYLEEFGDKLVKRFSQSSRDREKAIKKEVAELRKSFELAGTQPTAEQEAKLVEAAEKKYEQSSDDEEPEAPASASNANVDQAIQYMNAQIADVFSEVGTTVTKADPEFKDLQAAVDASWNDPKGLVKILRAADRAANAKAARLQSQTKTASARVVGGAGGKTTTTTPKLSAREKISKGLQGNFTKTPPPPQE
jgi:hypothetical protein